MALPFRGTLGINTGTFSGSFGCLAAAFLVLQSVGAIGALLGLVAWQIVGGGPMYQTDGTVHAAE